MRLGPHSWEDLCGRDLTGSTLTARVHGGLIFEGLSRVEILDEEQGRYSFYGSGGKKIIDLPIQPVAGPLIDEQNPDTESLHFTAGFAGEGSIILPCSVEQFFGGQNEPEEG